MFIELNPAYLIMALFLLTSGCFLYLCVVAFTENTNSKLRNDYLSSGVCLFLYSLFYGLMTITVNEPLRRIFWAVGFTSGYLFFSRWLLFSSDLAAIKHSTTRRIIGMASILAVIISVLCILSNDTVFFMTRYGVQFSYQNSPFFIIAIIYAIIIIFSFLILFLRWLRKSEMKRNRIQALLFLLFSAFIAPFGVVADFVIPVFTGNTVIPFAALCFFPISLPFFISMRKYKTLSITVPNASGYVFNTITIPTFVLDHKNNISLENTAASDFFGCSVIGKNISEIIFSNEKNPEPSFLDHDFTSEKITVETPLGVRICAMLLAIENDKYNDALCKVVLLRDITENEQKDVMLQAALEQANTASKAKSSFLSNMSHEIRTPMNAIIGMTSIAEATNDVERKDYAVGKIKNASNHLLGVINDILDISKIEENKFELSCVSFDFEKMMQKVVNVINFRIDERRQQFHVNMDNSIPNMLIGDDQRLSQVITNLLSNAVKFTPEEGTITLTARFISETDGVCRLQISVADTGIGISEDKKENVFQAFEQADTNTSRKYGGTGLGLSISKRIVEMMGGEIWVESELGRGSTFIFTANLQRDTDGKNKKSLLLEGVNWKNIRLFVVDDEPEVREFFLDTSASLGILCVAAASGEEAAQKLKEDDNYNMFFLDWKLPGMSGIELTRRIREEKEEKSIVILFSSTDWDTIEKDARAAGVDKFIQKPLFRSYIVDNINECIGAGSAVERAKNEKEPDDYTDHTILLAEDVEINREIVLALLEPTNLVIDCAENGTIAVDKFLTNPLKYDMIFMDVQMPEMDGYTATQKIRASAAPTAKDIPIIAMTANVFKEDIEKCLEAGMNDHISKPLDFDVVLDKLRIYLPNVE